jgi:tRNA-2-methylthio-N6-dimethylallyladenosine synthase
VTELAQTREGRRVFIETFGCQMNVLDSELVQDQLRALGYGFVGSADDADIVLYNTCSVRELSEHKVVSRLGVLRRRKQTEPELIVGVLGCMAERAGEDLVKKLPQIDLMCGPSELDRVPGLLESLTAERAQAREAQLALSGHNNRKRKKGEPEVHEEDRLEALDRGRAISEGAQAYVRITRGCNKFCSFCIVPFTRGEEVHRDPDAIVEEVRRLARAGAQEVTLLGQTINHYQHGETDFATLLKRAHDEVPELPRLRFLTSYPRDFTDAALDVMASSERMSRWLHIPAQSGSNDVLKRMNRGYTREEYLDLIRRARERMPDVAIVGDMIVGFPGETDEEFEASLSLLEEVRYKMVYVFKYSERPGTVASKKLDDTVPLSVKKVRNNRMLEVQQAISKRHHEAMVGTELEVLVEGAAKIDPKKRADGLVTIGKPKSRTRLSARTRGDHIIAFDGPEELIGQLVKVKVTEARELSLSGELA